jgi:murein DD-endopeptidase MepM/ murein hydrolase activator NlpD
MQWKAQAALSPAGGVAFGGIDGATVAARVRQMQQNGLPALSRLAVGLVGVAMAAILIASALLQPAIAFDVAAQSTPTAEAQWARSSDAQWARGSDAQWARGSDAQSIRTGDAQWARNSDVGSPPPMAFAEGAPDGLSAEAALQTARPADLAAPRAAAAAAQPQAAWRYPLEKMRVTGFFGVHRDVLATPHKGIDLGAAKGTPVHAVADGVVLAAGPLAENDGRYGNTVIIDHGGRQSLYAHLDSIAVKPGTRIAAGQTIGAVGETGFATGPHLHFEARQNGRLLDPADKLAGLDAYATKHALRVRRQQLTAGI